MSVQRLYIFVLNEFNRELLHEASLLYDLKNLSTFLQFSICETQTQDSIKSGLLEPWIQWPNAFSGVTSDTHQMRSYCEAELFPHKPIWNQLEEGGVKTAIWGAMNCPNRSRGASQLFMPDPWNVDQEIFSTDLYRLFKFKSLVASHYTSLPIIKTSSLFLSYLKALYVLGVPLTKISFELCKLFKDGLSTKKMFTAASFLDSVELLAYLSYIHRSQARFGVYFFTTLAHLQHSYWKKEYPLTDKVWSTYFKRLDQQLARVLNFKQKCDGLILMNGFSQVLARDQNILNRVYKIKDTHHFFQLAEIPFRSIQPHMTAEQTLSFHNQESLQKAFELLEAISVNGEKLFYIRRYDKDHLKLYCKIKSHETFPQTSTIQFRNTCHPFYSLIEDLGIETGCHSTQGTIYYHGIDLPKRMPLHHLHQSILNHFNSSPKATHDQPMLTNSYGFK